jgi:thiamine-phosphate pyrophosphorylase
MADRPVRSLADRRLYLCTPDRPDLVAFLEACIAGGVDVVQLRDKRLPDIPLLERAALAQRVCADNGVPFILNDRPDLAAEVGADGVHVGQDDVSPEEARRLLGESAIIGLSTHSREQLVGSLEAPVDYISAGPVTPTPTKPGRPGTGLGYIGEATARSARPVWVTGGVDPETVGPMVAAGARHFVVVRWLTEAADPRENASRLRQTIDPLLETAAGERGPLERGDRDG